MLRKLTRRIAFVALAAAAAGAVPVAGGPAAAAAPAAPYGATSYQEREVAAVLARHPGAKRIGAGVVEVAPGVRFSVGATPDAVQRCDTGWLCVNRDPAGALGFVGPQYSWFFCGTYELAGLFYNHTSAPVRDSISAIRNAQTGGVVSRFYDYDGNGGLHLIGRLAAGNYLRDLRQNPALWPTGTNMNDRIDRIFVC